MKDWPGPLCKAFDRNLTLSDHFCGDCLGKLHGILCNVCCSEGWGLSSLSFFLECDGWFMTLPSHIWSSRDLQSHSIEALQVRVMVRRCYPWWKLSWFTLGRFVPSDWGIGISLPQVNHERSHCEYDFFLAVGSHQPDKIVWNRCSVCSYAGGTYYIYPKYIVY